MSKKSLFGMGFILAAALLVRLYISGFKVILLDYDPFYHARIARIIYETKALPAWDYQELGGIPYYYPPVYHILIAFFKYFFPSLDYILIGSLLNMFFGLAAVGMLYLILNELFNEKVAMLSSAIYAFTPLVVIRTALLARPIGIAYFFAVLSLYFFLKINNGKLEKKHILSTFLVFFIFSFTHSLFLVFFLILIIESIFSGKNKKILIMLIISIMLLWAAYYFDFITNYFEPSLGYTAEYLPFVSKERIAPFLTRDLWDWVAAFLYLANGNLAYFPLVLHGIYISLKRKTLPFLAIFSFLSAFFKLNVFALFLFYTAVCVSLSIEEIDRKLADKRYRKAAAAFLIAFIFATSIYMLTAIASLTKNSSGNIGDHAEAIKETFGAVPLTEKDTVLANSFDVGHGIAYYTPAMVYISDLTDTKKWKHNVKIYNRLENATPKDAESIVRRESITYVLRLLSNQGEFSSFDWATEINSTKIYEKTYGEKNITVELYRLN